MPPSPPRDPDQPITPGIETWTAYLQRANVLIIGHGETVTAAAHLFLGFTPDIRASTAFAADYASITRWEQQPPAWIQPGAG